MCDKCIAIGNASASACHAARHQLFDLRRRRPAATLALLAVPLRTLWLLLQKKTRGWGVTVLF
jgi:hypothetical protein